MCQHLVHFYEDDYPADRVAEFFAAGLDAGDRCVALLTAAHRHAVEKCLQARGVGLESAAYVAVDTDVALSQMLVDGRLDTRRAVELLTPLMKSPVRKGRVRAAGDLAPTLLAAGNIDDALAFEALVHRITKEHGASTFCVYPIDPHRDGGLHAMLRHTAEHGAIGLPHGKWLRFPGAAVPAKADRPS